VKERLDNEIVQRGYKRTGIYQKWGMVVTLMML